jgi:hypothetical protein
MCSNDETEEFSPHSPPRKMATCAPLAYIIPNDVEGHEQFFFLSPFVRDKRISS